jgi:hypothetical protein
MESGKDVSQWNENLGMAKRKKIEPDEHFSAQ